MDGARAILLSITGGADLSLLEVSEAAKVVGEAAHPDANIIFGANVDERAHRPGLGHRRRHPLRPRRPRRPAAQEPTIRRTKEAAAARRRPVAPSGDISASTSPSSSPG